MFRLTRHGTRELLIGGAVLALMAMGLGYVFPLLALIILPVFIFMVAFFRDPERQLPTDQHAVVSPADGTVSDITIMEHDPLIGGPAVRVGIFLSVFNVHVNRSPCDGRVVAVQYKKGKFINAMRHNEASDENESNTIILAEPHGQRNIAVVKQIVGLIARRIVCTTVAGEQLRRGQRIGMIKFGSRTEVTLAKFLDPQIKVTVGQTVRGAADVIALLGNPIHTTAQAGTGSDFEPLIGRETPA